MISLVDRNDSFTVLDSEAPLGTVTAARNPYHAGTAYLTVALDRYDLEMAPEIFRRLRERLGKPLQVMLDSGDAGMAPFLEAGGFKRLRRCYVMRVSAGDLTQLPGVAVPVETALRDSAEHRACCELQYAYYAGTHEAVNPLTATLCQFCGALPDTALYYADGGNILHWAFVEGNEIAYVGSADPRSFRDFAGTLLARMLPEHSEVEFECDDCDSAAMCLGSFFDLTAAPWCDTYILK